MAIAGIGKRWAVIVAALVLLGALAACSEETAGGVGGAFDHPVLGERLVYVAGLDGHLYALDREGMSSAVLGEDVSDLGDSGWRVAVGDQRDPLPLIGGPALSTATDIPLVVVGSEDGNLYAYHAEEGGDPIWSFPTEDRIWSTPVVHGGAVYFGSHDNKIYALNVQDGTENWSLSTGGAVAGRPLIFRDLVIAGSYDKKLYGIEASSGVLRWTVEGDNWFWAGPVADERFIFAPNMDGNVYAVDVEGAVSWKYDLGSAIVSRPALVRGALVASAKNSREVSLLDTNPQTSDADRLIDTEFVSDSEIKAPLFVVGNNVYVGTQGSTVIRLDVGVNSAGRLDLSEAWCYDTEDNTECR
jgi:outer membrane protein assembly factor BamB